MSRVHRRGVVAGAGKSAAKTYAEFEAYVLAQPGISALSWGSTTSKVAGAFYTTGGTTSGSMSGTSWGSRALSTSRTSRLVQHAANSFDHYEEVRSNARISYLLLSTSAGMSLGIDRNNYASADITVSSALVQIDEIWYFIDGVGPLKGNPRNAVLAAPFTW